MLKKRTSLKQWYDHSSFLSSLSLLSLFSLLIFNWAFGWTSIHIYGGLKIQTIWNVWTWRIRCICIGGTLLAQLPASCNERHSLHMKMSFYSENNIDISMNNQIIWLVRVHMCLCSYRVWLFICKIVSLIYLCSWYVQTLKNELLPTIVFTFFLF